MKHPFPLLLLFALISGGHSLPGNAAELPEFEASYHLIGRGIHIGTSTLSLSYPEEGHYLYESRSWPLKLVSWILKDRLHESSAGLVDDSGFRPLAYRYERSGGRKQRRAKLAFNWETMQVENHVDGSNWKMDIPAGTVDKLVIQLGIMQALQAGKKDVYFRVADGGRLKDYSFQVMDREQLVLPAGTFDTVRVARVRENTERETIVWCAPALGYLPVRIRQRESDGSRLQIDIVNYSGVLKTGVEQPVAP